MLIKFKNHIPKLGQNVFVADGAKIIGEVQIGDESSVWFNCVLRADVNFIKIGARTNIQDLSTIHVWHREFNEDGSLKQAGFPTIMGDDVTIGHNCVIHACTIKDRVLVGMNAVIMDEAFIEEDSIVGAGSVVTKGKKFPKASLILGNPARLIRTLTPKEIEFLKQSALNYVEFKNEFLKDH
ncbi:gamma carbonic anhydrase family protein [Campylobacter hepaticus]|uniref:gamma carbonic anhydrase family protein n=1 Tax=Campylobacter hepaticus TaxID=1813019 RepID=UPI0029AB928F|nr:gamma carbonic anhydrase family protein [Campylobacter hepaticus]MDX2323907.1 gamma carbonic anhydrase family protein [Campylobacter hepaticus]MDX2333229.1 gamma carbonic anhydrase family protein [Campylobacter hepaticus]MDX2410157.1 gamma carbonic anhydrase family protein [Campylobacter hepaticus]